MLNSNHYNRESRSLLELLFYVADGILKGRCSIRQERLKTIIWNDNYADINLP